MTPGAAVEVDRRSDSTAVVECGNSFGAVGGRQAIDTAIEIANSHNTATVVTKQCNHVGRLGAYVQRAAEHGMIALATCNSPIHGHFVLPWGGKQGRLATNPIAYGIPSNSDPIVADFSTSVAPEGKVRFYRNQQNAVPDGWILDANGKPTNDPNDFYGPPQGGILPLGASAGHKGYALSLLVEILGNALAGQRCNDDELGGNGVCFIVINPASFCPIDEFRTLIDETIAYMKSSEPAPGFDEVLVPGELEFRILRERTESGIPLDDLTRDAIIEHATRLNVNCEAIQ